MHSPFPFHAPETFSIIKPTKYRHISANYTHTQTQAIRFNSLFDLALFAERRCFAPHLFTRRRRRRRRTFLGK